MIRINFNTSTKFRKDIEQFCVAHNLEYSHWHVTSGHGWCIRSTSQLDLIEVIQLAGFTEQDADDMVARSVEQKIA